MRISEIILKKNLQLWGSNGPNGQLYTTDMLPIGWLYATDPTY